MSADAGGVADAYGRLAEGEFFGDFFERSDYLNFGYRANGSMTQREACDALVDALLACLPRAPATVLDVACGKGATTRRLSERYPEAVVTAVNISREQLDRTRENAPAATVVEMDATRLEFDDGLFDAAICVEAAFHFVTRQMFLEQAARILKPGGRLVLSDMLLAPWSPIQSPANMLDGPDAYERCCLDAGFADAWIVDAREACWGGIRDALAHDTGERLWQGELRPHEAMAIFSWLRRGEAAIRHYVIGCCTKAGG